jgi:hypothetical protein
MHVATRLCLCSLSCLLLTAPALAADDMQLTRPMGMGEAYRAVANGSDTLFLNPAGLSLYKRYAFDIQYLITPDYLEKNGPEEHIFSATVLDNQLGPFATGVAYTRVQRTGDTKHGNRYDTAFAFPIGDMIHLGIDIKYLNFDRKGREDAVDAVTVDVGALVVLPMGFSLGVVGYNLTNTGDYLEHPISMAAAVAWSPFRSLVLAFDWYGNFQRLADPEDMVGKKDLGYRFCVGAEYLVFGELVIRAGYQYDDATPYGAEHWYSFGAGYVTESFGVDLGYRGPASHGWGGTAGISVRLFL